MNLAPQQQQQQPNQYPQLPPQGQQPQPYQPQQQNYNPNLQQMGYDQGMPANPMGPQPHMPPLHVAYHPPGIFAYQYNTGQLFRERQGMFFDKQVELDKKKLPLPSKMYGQQAIDMTQGVVIKQQVRELQAQCCCEQEFSYLVHPADNEGRILKNDTQPMFKVVEQSQCCQRAMCWGSCRPFELQVLNFKGESEVFLKAIRQHTCDCLCCDRPYIDIYRFDNFKHTKIGSILHRFSCDKVIFEIYDSHGQKKWKFDDGCCQCALICRPFCCSSCKKAKFDITDGEAQKFSQVFTRNNGCCKGCNGEEDSVHVVFPRESSYDDKLLLLIGGIFLQYRYLEDNAICVTGNTKRQIF